MDIFHYYHYDDLHFDALQFIGFYCIPSLFPAEIVCILSLSKSVMDYNSNFTSEESDIRNLNVNGLNALTKRHRLAEWIQKQEI